MNLKLRALGLALLAAVATGALTVANAPANTGGHFTSDVSHTIVSQTAQLNSPHTFRITLPGLSGVIFCKQSVAFGTATGTTMTEVEGETDLKECYTEGSEVFWGVHMNGCKGRGTVASGNPETTEQTNDLVCPTGQAIVVTHPNCTITVPPQTHASAFTYTRIKVSEKYAITMDVTMEYGVQYHSGICIFLGTNHKAVVEGSTVIRGTDTEGNYVNITST